MAQENSEGIAYLMALKRPAVADEIRTTAGESPASTTENVAAGQSTELYRGPEKRRSPRYRCEGSVEICEEGCEVRTWASRPRVLFLVGEQHVQGAVEEV